jgi:hypothetical protein
MKIILSSQIVTLADMRAIVWSLKNDPHTGY